MEPEGRPPIPENLTAAPKSGRRRLRRVIVATLALGSLGLNVGLGFAAFTFYRTIHADRLDPTNGARMEAANAALSPPRPGVPRVVLFGDSRAFSWKPSGLQGCEVVNRGVPYQTTSQILLRLDRDVLRLKPQVAVVEAGINDLKTIGLFPDQKQEIVDRCRSNLRSMVERMRDQRIRVVVLTIFPVGKVEVLRRPIWSDATIDAVDEMNRDLKAMEGEGVTVVDCDSVLREGRLVKPAYSEDFLHLNRAGYRALDEVALPAVGRAAVMTEEGAGER